jgi:hypothetical protein
MIHQTIFSSNSDLFIILNISSISLKCQGLRMTFWISFLQALEIAPRSLGYSYRVFHFEVSISAPQLDLGSRSQQILTLARVRSIWNFQLPGAKARALPVDVSDALDSKPVR